MKNKPFKVQSPKQKTQSPNPKAQASNPKAQSPKPKDQSPNSKVQALKPKAQSPKPKVQSPKQKTQGLNFKALVVPILACILLLLLTIFGSFLYANWTERVIVGVLLTLIMACATLYGRRLFKDTKTLILVTVILFIALFSRMLCFDILSPDYYDCLGPWVEEFRVGGGFQALETTTSNYNLLYDYFLALISYVNVFDMYLIKLLSVAFDLVLAFALSTVVISQSKKAALIGFAAVLFWPTFFINSACWGQCDSIFTSFCVLSFYFILKGKPKTSVLLAGIAFTFKLQAIFFLPAFIIYLIARRVKLWHAALFPIPYIITSLPALFLGWTPARIISIYTGQVGLYNDYLQYNAASLFSFWPLDAPWQPYANIGLSLAVLFLLLLFARAFLKREKLSDNTELLTAYTAIIALGLPWLLPAMHERYFYVAEAFVLLYAALRPKWWFLAPLVLIGSLGSYVSYILISTFSADIGVLWLFALIMLVALVLAIISVTLFHPTQPMSAPVKRR